MSAEQILAVIAVVVLVALLSFGMMRRTKLGGPQKYARAARDGDFPDGPNRTPPSPFLWLAAVFGATTSSDQTHAADTSDSSDSGGGDGGGGGE